MCFYILCPGGVQIETTSTRVGVCDTKFYGGALSVQNRFLHILCVCISWVVTRLLVVLSNLSPFEGWAQVRLPLEHNFLSVRQLYDGNMCPPKCVCFLGP